MSTVHLYIKQHRQTKLKYFGVTIKNPFKYKGSGTAWKQHLKEHGEDVETIAVYSYHDREEATNFAFQFSIKNDIVASSEWANLQLEGSHSKYERINPERARIASLNYTRRKKLLHKETAEERATRLQYQRQWRVMKKQSDPDYWKRNYQNHREKYIKQWSNG